MGVNWRWDEWKKVINIRSLKLKLSKHTEGATILFIQEAYHVSERFTEGICMYHFRLNMSVDDQVTPL